MLSFSHWQYRLFLPEQARRDFRFRVVILVLLLVPLTMLSACVQHSVEQFRENVLKSVAAASATDVWAVGEMSNASLRYQVLIEHWNGKEWQTVPASLPGSLSGIAAITGNDAWAVGVTTGGIMLTMHWDGVHWSKISNPDLSPVGGGTLSAVAAVSSHDVWAVGTQGDFPAIRHWNGQRWKSVAPTFPPAFRTGALSSVQAISSTNVWAVGWYEKSTAGTIQYPLVEHWDGQSWQPVPTADLPQDQYLPGSTFSSLITLASGNLWAVGETNFVRSPYPSLLVEHRAGSQWQVDPLSADASAGLSYQQNIFGTNAQNLWITGYQYSLQALTNYPVLLHWNGQSWDIATPPALQTTSGVFFAGTAISANDLWVVGSSGGVFWPAGNFSSQPPDSHTLIEHWDGTSWKTVPSPNPGQSIPVLEG